MGRSIIIAAGILAVGLTSIPAAAPAIAAGASGDPLCTGNYAIAPAHGAPRRIRFGIDPGIAGSIGGTQLPSIPDNLVKDRAAVRRLRPQHRALVVRLNRLFWSDGEAGIRRFKRLAASYTRMGDEVEIQVRYHPRAADDGDVEAWKRYVRHVVDVLGANRRVVAMTITNEVNISFSSNTSDGSYKRAEDALIQGIVAGHAEAVKRHRGGIRFGFTYAYRFIPSGDAAFFHYLAMHGGRAFRRALGFMGLDFYPGTLYPPAMLPGDTYRHELAQAAGALRNCFAPMGHVGRGVPIWITEDGIPTGVLSPAQQAGALRALVDAVHLYSRMFGITDYRWFNLRDSISTGPETLNGLTFASFGLLRSDYVPKPSFAAYRGLIAALGSRSAAVRAVR